MKRARALVWEPAVGARVELVCTAAVGTRASRVVGRFYALEVMREGGPMPLFDNVIVLWPHARALELVVTKGRVGGRMATRREVFASAAALGARWDRLVRARLRHGYEIARVRAPCVPSEPVRGA
jgi:predicted DNA-binding WGR domain protein